MQVSGVRAPPEKQMSLHAAATVAIDDTGTTAESLDRARARSLLLARVRDALSGDERGRRSLAWLHDSLNAVADPGGSARTFDLAFGMTPRRLGRSPLVPSEAERAAFGRAADAAIAGWNPSRWRLDEASRALLLTALDETLLPVRLAATLRHADLGEQLALYRALPLLPPHRDVTACARRGLRSNVRAVFEAIAHDNPWPAAHLDEPAWNQLVLKALFAESALAPIQGLDERANPELATMLLDHAHERRGTGRRVAVELWRALGPFATLDSLAPFLPGGGTYGTAATREPWPADADSGALALAALASRDGALRELAAECSPHAADIRAGHFGWSDFCKPGERGDAYPS